MLFFIKIYIAFAYVLNNYNVLEYKFCKNEKHIVKEALKRQGPLYFIKYTFKDALENVGINIYLVTIHTYREKTFTWFFENIQVRNFSKNTTHMNMAKDIRINISDIPRNVTYFYFQMNFTSLEGTKHSLVTQKIYTNKYGQFYNILPRDYHLFLKTFATKINKKVTIALFGKETKYNTSMDNFIDTFEMSHFMYYVLGVCLVLGVLLGILSYILSHAEGVVKKKRTRKKCVKLSEILN
ncbi:hypothetical protein EHP00_708 [Ecytonucleospora hepatopenaei]|uniref:Uncharacterized protein n=1 Tax=Ecytonucleospora hepatopenaei TaxID=646526 RepID=A0A1W0E3T5_9MICR|nr:hypothetical protein EHP00_708 [Ecytonucleospora hepatopenaei]